MDMVERVARAICGPQHAAPWENMRHQQWELHVKQARAAIEAMREGNNGMWSEGARHFTVPVHMAKRMVFIRDIFRAMIDAALNKDKAAL